MERPHIFLFYFSSTYHKQLAIENLGKWSFSLICNPPVTQTSRRTKNKKKAKAKAKEEKDPDLSKAQYWKGLLFKVVLFNAVHLLQHENKFIDLFWVWKNFGHSLSVHAPFHPGREFGTMVLNLKPPTFLIRHKPAGQSNGYDVKKPKGITTKEVLLPKSSL